MKSSVIAHQLQLMYETQRMFHPEANWDNLCPLLEHLRGKCQLNEENMLHCSYTRQANHRHCWEITLGFYNTKMKFQFVPHHEWKLVAAGGRDSARGCDLGMNDTLWMLNRIVERYLEVSNTQTALVPTILFMVAASLRWEDSSKLTLWNLEMARDASVFWQNKCDKVLDEVKAKLANDWKDYQAYKDKADAEQLRVMLDNVWDSLKGAGIKY